MEKIIHNDIVQEVLELRLPYTNEFQKCSYIAPNGKMLIMTEHYEAQKFLVVEGLVQCIPDAEQLLNELGYLRYSFVGYLTLSDTKPTDEQYKALEFVLINIAKLRDEISIQIQNEPRFYLNMQLDDIPYIIERIKLYYATGKLLP